MLKPNKGCRCSALHCNEYSAISEYPFHRFPSNNKGKVI